MRVPKISTAPGLGQEVVDGLGIGGVGVSVWFRVVDLEVAKASALEERDKACGYIRW